MLHPYTYALYSWLYVRHGDAQALASAKHQRTLRKLRKLARSI